MSLTLPKEAIRNLVASLAGLSPTRVVWHGEAEKVIGPVNGVAAKVTLNPTANAENGTIEPRRKYVPGPTPDQTIQWGVHRTVTVSMRADNFLGAGSAYDTLEKVRFMIALPPARALLRAANLAFIDAPLIVVTQQDYVVDTRVVSSATLDVRLAFLASPDVASDPDGWIEKVSHTTPADIDSAPVVDLELTRIG